MYFIDEPSDEDIRRSMGMTKEEFYCDPQGSLISDMEIEQQEYDFMRSYYPEVDEEIPHDPYHCADCALCGKSYQGAMCPDCKEI